MPEELLKQMFSFDFNNQIEAADFISENLENAMEISDILLK